MENRKKPKVLGLIVCLVILAVTVPLGIFTKVFSFQDLKSITIDVSVILKVIIMAAAVIAAESLTVVILGLPKPKSHRIRSVLSIISSLLKYVAGIVILCVGLLALISQFIPSGGGLLNGATMLTRGLGGTLCLLLPVVLCWVGVTLVFFSSGRMSLRTMICGALLFLFVETLMQLFEISAVVSAIFADGQQAT